MHPANANTSRATEGERGNRAGKIVFAVARRYWQVLRPSPRFGLSRDRLEERVIYGRERVKNPFVFNAFAAERNIRGELPLSATRIFSARLIGSRKRLDNGDEGRTLRTRENSSVSPLVGVIDGVRVA